MSDQFIGMNVLADRALKTIDNAPPPDLWWAMRGAGHNFGIATSVITKIYDVEHADWAYQSFTFTNGRLQVSIMIPMAITEEQHAAGKFVNYGSSLTARQTQPGPPLLFISSKRAEPPLTRFTPPSLSMWLYVLSLPRECDLYMHVYNYYVNVPIQSPKSRPRKQDRGWNCGPHNHPPFPSRGTNRS